MGELRNLTGQHSGACDIIVTTPNEWTGDWTLQVPARMDIWMSAVFREFGNWKLRPKLWGKSAAVVAEAHPVTSSRRRDYMMPVL